MADNKTIRRQHNATRVNVHELYEIDYWCEKWDCSVQQLKAAVAAVGTSAAAVAKHLGK